MLIKKLAVPLINDKLLMQATHCCLAVSGISLEGFEFIRSRIPTTCKIEIVTGIDEPTDPEVLSRILKHYAGRITVRVYLKNVFKANMFLFDLPYRKSVAFVGSGLLTLEGLKDGETIFWRVTDPKEIESLKSWFTGYFEFGEPLTEEIVREYEIVYKRIMQRQILSHQDKHDVMELTTREFAWESIKFKLQFFKKEDYQVLSPGNSYASNPIVALGRETLKQKLTELAESIKRDISLIRLHLVESHTISQISLQVHPQQRVNELGLAYGRSESILKKFGAGVSMDDFLSLQICIRQREIRIALVGHAGMGRIDRENMLVKISEPDFRSNFLKLFSDLGHEFKAEVAGNVRLLGTFQNEEALQNFLNADDWKYYNFWIGRSFSPGDPAISSEKIADTIVGVLKLLVPVYEAIKFES
jgi:hypothetical protein